MSDTIFCTNCGTRISARARFCPSCGARQDEFHVDPAPPSADPPRMDPAPAEPPRAKPPPPAAEPPRMDPAPAEPPRVKPPPAAVEPPRMDLPPPAGEPPPSVAEPPPRAEPPPSSVLPRLKAESAFEAAVPDEPVAPPPAAMAPPPPVQRQPEPPEYSQPEATVPRPPSMQERIGRVDPQAAELSNLLRERLALPGIVAGMIAGSVAAAIVLAAGLIIGLVSPDVSLIGLVGVDANFLTEAFRQANGTVLTPMLALQDNPLLSSTRRIHPLLFLAIPLAALIWTTRWQLHRTEGAAPLARIVWAMFIAVPFALWMLVFAIVGGNSPARQIDVSAGNAFALGLLWGLIGGFIGALTKLPAREAVNVPPVVDRAWTAILATLRPLAALLLACTAIALVGWLVQVGADTGGVRADRSAPTALIEEAIYSAEHGIHLTALAGGARFRADSDGPIGLPFPVERANDVPGSDGTFRIFAYNDVMPAYVLLPALVILLGLTVLAALYAGFAAARATHAASPARAAAWGAITGPAWAICMTVLIVLAGGYYHGDADDGSVFGVFLIGGAILGAAGAVLAVSGQSSASGDEPERASS